MALVFPRDMISPTRWRTPRLGLDHRQELARSADGTLQAKDLGPAIWRAKFETVPLPLADADAVMADFETLCGAARVSISTIRAGPGRTAWPIPPARRWRRRR